MSLREYEEKNYHELLAQENERRKEQVQNLRYSQVKRPTHRWEAQEAKNAFQKYVDQHNRLPLHTQFGPRSGLPSAKLFEQLVGMTITEYKKMFFPDLLQQAKLLRKQRISEGHRARDDAWSKERAIAEVERFVRETGRFPTQGEMKPEVGLPSVGTFKNVVGMSVRQYAKLNNPELVEQAEIRRKKTLSDKNRSRAYEKFGYDEEAVLSAVEHFIELNGRLPTEHEHSPKYGLPNSAVYLRLFGKTPTKLFAELYPELHANIERYRREKIRRTSRKKLATENGISALNPETGWDKKSVLLAVETFIARNNRLPLVKEFRVKNGLPNYMTFLNVIGKTPPEYFKSRPDYRHYFREKKQSYQEERADIVRLQINNFILREKRPPHCDEFTSDNNLPYYCTVTDALGMTVTEYFKENYPEYHKALKPYLYLDNVLEAIKNFYEQTGKLPITSDFQIKNGLPNYHSILSRFGMTLIQFLEKFFPDSFDRNQHRPLWNKNSIIEQVHSFYERFGRPPNSSEFYNRNGLPAMSTFLHHMKELPSSYCLREYADYFFERKEARMQFIIESYGNWITKHGRQPSNKEVKQERLPSKITIKASFDCDFTEFLQNYFPDYPSYMQTRKECVLKVSELSSCRFNSKGVQDTKKETKYSKTENEEDAIHNLDEPELGM